MPSHEVFVNNIRCILKDRGMLIKDLAAKAGISGSYLSLLLNGGRRNVSDDVRDRIASVLGVTISRLYADPSEITESSWMPAPSHWSPRRRELRDVVDTFLQQTNLEEYQGAFYEAMGLLDDTQATSVHQYLSDVLARSSASGNHKEQPDISALSSRDRRVLAYFAVAGDGAKLDWIREICDVESRDFDRSAETLRAIGVVDFVEGCGATRVKMSNSAGLPLIAMFTQSRLRGIYLSLSVAMQNHPDFGPAFEARLAKTLLKAGMTSESAAHLQNAASAIQKEGLFSEAARHWHQAAVIYGSVGQFDKRESCLAESAICYCRAGDLAVAEEIALSIPCEDDTSDKPERGLLILRFASSVEPHDADCALKWYKKSLRMIPRDHPRYGAALINLASCALQVGRLEDAHSALAEMDKWLAYQDQSDQYVKGLRVRRLLIEGYVAQEQREWKRSRDCYERVLTEDGGDTVDSAVALQNIGDILLLEDKVDDAEVSYERAFRAYEALGLDSHQRFAQIDLARVALRKNDLGRASELLAQVMPSLGEEPRRAKGWAYLVNASLHRVSGRLRQSISEARKALEVFNRSKAMREYCCTSLWLSRVFDQMGDKGARGYYENCAYHVYQSRRWDVKDLLRECDRVDPLAISD